MLFKIRLYLRSNYDLIYNRSYLIQLSVTIGIVLTAFVYFFDPYDNYLDPPKYDIPIRVIQLGYGIIAACIVYLSYWTIFHKLQFKEGEKNWKVYHQWIVFAIVNIISGFLGLFYHRLLMDVGEVELNYLLFITTPRTIVLGISLFVIALLLDQLSVKSKNSSAKIIHDQNALKDIVLIESPSVETVQIKSPFINQSIELQPRNITYLKACGNYVEISMKEGEQSQMLRASLHFVAEELAAYTFIKKCHRQYYVNINDVESFDGNSQKLMLTLETSKVKIPVSKTYVQELLSVLN